jgi:cytochrome oxidase Cu insertion factor (SCO1/SenC/PrrC family)
MHRDIREHMKEVSYMSSDLYVSDLAACPSFYYATRDDQAPLFTAESITNAKIEKVNLNDFKGKWVLLFFYPSDFTFV